MCSNLKNFSVFLLSCCAFTSLSAQCLSGDCINGSGSRMIRSGIYTGQFRNGEPEGQGVYEGIIERSGPRIDSVRDEGLFRNGLFLQGRRTLLHSWDEMVKPSDFYNINSGTWTGNAYRFESASYAKDFGNTYDYPYLKTRTVTQTDGKGKTKTWKETYIDYDNGTYTGEIRKGLPNGKGRFETPGLSFTGIFENGLPVSQSEDGANFISGIKSYPAASKNSVALSAMRFDSGHITTLTMRDNEGIFTYILRKPVSITDFIFEGDHDGYFEVRENNGNVYTGMINQWKFAGSGELHYRDHVYQGQFAEQNFYGAGKLKGPVVTLDGFFIRGIFSKGEIVNNATGARTHFPVCLSGDCENGTGKVSYTLKPTADNYQYYEGNFQNGFPNGAGTKKTKNGATLTTVTGNFVQGMINGEAVYEGNAGIVTRMKGLFVNDTLKSGTVYYSDRSAFAFDTYRSGVERNKRIVLPSTVGVKHIDGYGKYYTPAGATVEGTFYLDGERLFEGVYADNQGNRFRMGFNVNGEQINTADVDAWGQRYVAQIRAEQEEKRRAAAEYAVLMERARKYEEAERDPANFKEEYALVPCSVCYGKGYILSGYAVGAVTYVSQEYQDSKGDWKRDVVGFTPAHNVTSRTPCDACFRKGKVYVKQRKYIGPKF